MLDQEYLMVNHIVVTGVQPSSDILLTNIHQQAIRQ